MSSYECTMKLFGSFLMKPSGNIGVYDPAEIYQRHQLQSYMKLSMVKLGHHLIFFFLYLYRFCLHSLLIYHFVIHGVDFTNVKLTLSLNSNYGLIQGLMRRLLMSQVYLIPLHKLIVNVISY